MFIDLFLTRLSCSRFVSFALFPPRELAALGSKDVGPPEISLVLLGDREVVCRRVRRVGNVWVGWFRRRMVEVLNRCQRKVT